MLNPETDSILSKVPPKVPSPRPDNCGTAAPKDATKGQRGRDILSPTPPVECLSTVGFPTLDKSKISPLLIMASVHTLSSCLFNP